MDLVARLHRVLTGPAPEDAGFTVTGAELAALPDAALGDLLPAAYAVPSAVKAWEATSARFAVEDAAKERQPAFGPDACRRMFDALVTGLERRKWADLTLGTAALVRCTGPWPDDLGAPARTLVRFLLDADDLGAPLALLAAAGLAADPPEPGGEGGLLAEAAGRLSRGAGPIARSEIGVIAGLRPSDRVGLTELDRRRTHTAPPPLPDAWHRAAAIPAYAAWAESALREAADRADAVQDGTIPYKADKAFAADEVVALGRAARVALAADAPWLPALLDRLLPGIAVAPTAAKTLPSQALLYEIARAAQDVPTPELVTALRDVRGTVRHAAVPKQLDRMLKKADAALAERTEVALRLPDLGFGPDGVLRRDLGGHTAVVAIEGTAARLAFVKDGRELRSAPAAVRRDHKDALKELRDLVKRVGAQLATLCRALEGGLAGRAAHPFGWWRDRLAGHPVAGATVRALIWEVETAPGAWTAVLPETGALPDAPDDAAVRLWHPVGAPAEDVRAWRDAVVERGVRQPFKQAFRETYRLTPAEREARADSARFAGHLVRYRRMYALFRARGWTSGMLGPWDGGSADEASRVLAGEWRIRFGHVLAEPGPEDLAATDRVRFDRFADGAWRAAELPDVPPAVFSEAMRDVDLFVSVASIAADPDWTGDGPALAYWERARFGELDESALTRRDALARVLPRTKIADRCELDGRFLVVRGALRTYRIHLGSANVRMDPDDAYLCVVPDRRPSGRVLLPFEEERLALILSKAFLLAADDAITDPSILEQIGRGAR
ncbi:DUF4132 domain-containing protein [Actinomadura sp. WAC 06369]|uniref:DUF4132 domain-containing protein n=1 Tax=Actinomadura sp. WAC 06369 TaxID=2203193 RepID=UPI000F7AA7B6|nr:DUF4132 domain-containing protein [Actinomadura sp. WAC 06369]RSN68306.1 hypothetical protein DMH08_11350 [Actinomadura sp. WAC 06369]